jgi:F0F1-type ATP synthase, epsilon subunit (mitochondrial delta subunit)
MAKTFTLEIVTPEKRFYSGEVETVIARTLTGEEGFLANHIWACKLLDSGVLKIREAGSKELKRADISGGFVDVHGDILIYTDSAEWK